MDRRPQHPDLDVSNCFTSLISHLTVRCSFFGASLQRDRRPISLAKLLYELADDGSHFSREAFIASYTRPELRETWRHRGWQRKLKGRALVELPGGEVVEAEVHRYEAHGIGRQEMKVKRVLE